MLAYTHKRDENGAIIVMFTGTNCSAVFETVNSTNWTGNETGKKGFRVSLFRQNQVFDIVEVETYANGSKFNPEYNNAKWLWSFALSQVRSVLKESPTFINA